MRQRARKFVGIFIIIALLFIYPAIASVIYERFLSGAQAFLGEAYIWILLVYFAVAGFLWVIPAGIVIKWMAKPDDDISK